MSPTRIAVLVALSTFATAAVLLGWIALVYVVNVHSSAALSAEAALNLILVASVAVVGLPVLHAAVYRWFWHIRRKQAAGESPPGADMPAFGSESTQPPPQVRRGARQIGVYGLLYLVGIGSLIAACAPLGHQSALTTVLWRFSVGRASFSSLVQLVIVFLPMTLSFACLVPVFEADRKRVAAGDLSDAEALGLQDRQEWLSSFATAFVMAGFLSFIAGNMILAHL